MDDEPAGRGAEPKDEKRDRRRLRGEATRERVLDAAERLFADHGYDGVSIRDIAREAGVTLGVVGFHGGGKDSLFRTILSRRVEALSTLRRAGLARLEAAPEACRLRDLVEAYMRPYIELAATGGVQWRAYAKLIAGLAGDDDRWYGVVRDFYDPVAQEYLAAIRRIHPEADPVRLAAAFVMAVAAMLSAVGSNARMRGLAPESTPPASLSDYGDALVDFCTGGLAAVIAARS